MLIKNVIQTSSKEYGFLNCIRLPHETDVFFMETIRIFFDFLSAMLKIHYNTVMEIGIREHALFYGLLAKNVCLSLGKAKGKQIMHDITYAYGYHRGERMRNTALQNGDTPDMLAYFVYGEWKGKQGENISTMEYRNDCSISTVHKCAWIDTWQKYDLMDYGPLYCRDIDVAIKDGFNGGFDLTVEKSKGRGDDVCLFHWTQPADETKLLEIKKENKDRFIKPFSFHVQDLLEAAEKILAEKVPDKAEQILQRTKTDYEQETGI